MRRDVGVGKLIGVDTSGEGFKSALKSIGKHTLSGAKHVAKTVEPIATNIAGKVLEKKLKEQFGLGVKKNRER